MTIHHDNAKVFMALCDVTRLKVLELLRTGEKSASTLLLAVDAGQSTLSHHMKILVESGIVTARKSGKWTYYSISESGCRYATGLLKLLTSTGRPAEVSIPYSTIKEKRRSDILKPFTIVIDTSCDLPQDFIAQHNIEIMPIPFMLDGVEHNKGYWQDISANDFYGALRNGGVANTSQINPDAFVKVFTEFAKQDKDAVFIILSSRLSATYQSSLIALAEVKEQYPSCNIYPIDSIGAASANGLLVEYAVKKREEGLSAEETAALLNEKMHRIFGIFTVDDLMYLHRGGRLSKLSAIGGSMLGIKPILNLLPDGSLALKEKVRGRETALKLMVSQLLRSIAPNTTIDTICISHTDCEDDARKLAGLVTDVVSVRRTEIITLGPVIGSHVGPGAVTLIFEANMTREEYEEKFYS